VGFEVEGIGQAAVDWRIRPSGRFSGGTRVRYWSRRHGC